MLGILSLTIIRRPKPTASACWPSSVRFMTHRAQSMMKPARDRATHKKPPPDVTYMMIKACNSGHSYARIRILRSPFS